MLLPPLGEARKLLEHEVEVFRNPLAVLAQIAAHLKVFRDRHLRKNMSAFGAMGDPEREDLPRGGVGDIGTIKKDLATCR